MDISLNMVDKTLAGSLFESDSFAEFCSDLDELSLLCDNELYLEAMTTKQQGIKKTASKVYSNTVDSTRAAGKVLRYSTDAGGGFLAASWKLVMSAAMLIAKIAKWIFTHIDKVILLVSDGVNAISNIPSDIKNKIKGNIKLYITAQDISNIYSINVGYNNTSLMGKLNQIIKDLDELTRGEMWTTYFSNKSSVRDFFKFFNDDFINEKTKNRSDMKIIKKIIKEYDAIRMVNFSQTVIEMNKPEVVELYFGVSNKIKFRNFKNEIQELTYLEALYDILDHINMYKDTMKQLQDSVGDKFVASTNNESFSNMGKTAQTMVTKLFQTIAKTIEILGNITRYAMADIKTIEKSANQMKAAVTKHDNRAANSAIDKSKMMAEFKRRQSDGDDISLDQFEKEWAAAHSKDPRQAAIEEYEEDEVAKYYKKHPLKKLKSDLKNKKEIKTREAELKAKEKEKEDRQKREEDIISRLGPDVKEVNKNDPTNPQNRV